MHSKMKGEFLFLLVLWVSFLAEKVTSFQTVEHRTFSQRPTPRTSLGLVLEISTAPEKALTSPLFLAQTQSTDFGSSRWMTFPQRRRRSCLFASSTDADSEDETNPAVGILSRMFSLLLLPLVSELYATLHSQM